MTFRIGTDIGGTFTDLSISKDGHLVGRFKSPTTRDNLSYGVIACIELAARRHRNTNRTATNGHRCFCTRLSVATNAVLEGKVATTGFFALKAPNTLYGEVKDVATTYSILVTAESSLGRPRYCIELNERINSDGEIVIQLRENDVIDACDQLKNLGCDAVAISLLWSIRNATHEKNGSKYTKRILA